MTIKFGWIPDIPDHRDYYYYKIMPPVKLPSKVNLCEKRVSQVEDQEELGSCTANALVGNLEYIDIQNGDGYTDQSRLFIYYNERLLRGTINEDSGAMLRDGIKSLVKWGSCAETVWEYKINIFTKKPSVEAYRLALRNRIIVYYRINTLNEMLICLASGFPFVFGFAVYESFMTDTVARTGVARLPKRNERMWGGHAVMAVGYDNKNKTFLIRNSRGTNWGKKGYFTLPYKYFESRDLSDDFWTIRK